MMKWCKSLILLAVLPLILSGCVSELDRKQFAVRQQAYAVAEIYATTSEVLVSSHEQLQANYKVALNKLKDSNWNAWASRHTDANGGLVSRDANNNIVPLSLEDLNHAIEDREADAAQITAIDQAYTKRVTLLRESTDKFREVMKKLARDEIDVLQAKEELTAATNGILQAALTSASIVFGVK